MRNFFVLFLTLAACDPVSSAPPEEFSDCSGSDGDPIDVSAVSITGDTLSVDVGHGGGCADHTYTICWPDQSFMESMPVQVNLEVFHDANGDECEAYLTPRLSFDLTPLKLAYAEAYGEAAGTITVHVDGQTVDYEVAFSN